MAVEQIGKKDAFGNEIIGFVGPSTKGTWKFDDEKIYPIKKHRVISAYREGQGSVLHGDGSLVMTSNNGDLQSSVRRHLDSTNAGGFHNEPIEMIACPFNFKVKLNSVK